MSGRRTAAGDRQALGRLTRWTLVRSRFFTVSFSLTSLRMGLPCLGVGVPNAPARTRAPWHPSQRLRTAPSLETVLDTLAQPRLLDLHRLFACEVRDATTSKDRLVRKLELRGGHPRLLKELGRDELRAACRCHGLPYKARARVELQGVVLQAAGIDPKVATDRRLLHAPRTCRPRGKSCTRAIACGSRRTSRRATRASQRSCGSSVWMTTVPDASSKCCGTSSSALAWSGPRRTVWAMSPGSIPPAHFGAHLHALKSSVDSAAAPNLFQAHLRAGIKLMAHQIAPLMKALEQPRAASSKPVHR